MQVVYANQPFPTSWTSAIFLAGPTPRVDDAGTPTAESWRPKALATLRGIGYDGVVFIPEDEDGKWQHSYDDQIIWEERGLNFADVIIFWVPRDLGLTESGMMRMPAFTTNDEWGFWKKCDPSKVILGSPDDAHKMKYQTHYAKEYSIQQSQTLYGTCQQAVDKIQALGAVERTAGERHVPLHVWHTSAFQNWYADLRRAGNRLDHAQVEWTFRVGEHKEILFMWALQVSVYVTRERRHKHNEFILARPDISCVVLYTRSTKLLDTQVALVREFRSPVSNHNGMVRELPGGSTFAPGQAPEVVAAEEVSEELGIAIPPERFDFLDARQLYATMLTHKAYLFAVELTESEYEKLVIQAGKPHGAVGSSEITYGEFASYRKILNSPDIDWSTVGMVSKVLLTR